MLNRRRQGARLKCNCLSPERGLSDREVTTNTPIGQMMFQVSSQFSCYSSWSQVKWCAQGHTAEMGWKREKKNTDLQRGSQPAPKCVLCPFSLQRLHYCPRFEAFSAQEGAFSFCSASSQAPWSWVLLGVSLVNWSVTIETTTLKTRIGFHTHRLRCTNM